jgi:hypothetical protein
MRGLIGDDVDVTEMGKEFRGYRSGPFFAAAGRATGGGVERARFVTTGGIVTETLSERQFQVAESSVTVDWSMCRGCPGFCAAFLSVAARADELLKVVVARGRPMPRALASRWEMLALEFGRFVRALHEDGRGEVPADVLSMLGEKLAFWTDPRAFAIGFCS